VIGRAISIISSEGIPFLKEGKIARMKQNKKTQEKKKEKHASVKTETSNSKKQIKGRKKRDTFKHQA